MSATENKHNNAANIRHDSAEIDATKSMTFNMGSGTDTDTNRYLALPDGIAYGISVMPTVACSVTAINGFTLKAPMSIGVQGWSEPNAKIFNFTIQASSDTTVEVEGKC